MSGARNRLVALGAAGLALITSVSGLTAYAAPSPSSSPASPPTGQAGGPGTGAGTGPGTRGVDRLPAAMTQ